MEEPSLIRGLVMPVPLVALYFLPSILAARRGHSKGGSIFIVNLFLGWTLIGWVIALSWALTEQATTVPTREDHIIAARDRKPLKQVGPSVLA